MITLRSWNEVLSVLSQYPWRSRLRIPKGILPHPQAVNMTVSLGMPEGQIADYRLVLSDGSGLHVKDFKDFYEAHLDESHPAVNLVEHARQDAPGAFVGGSAAIGAAIGGLLGKSWQAALAGAAIAGLVGAILAVTAREDIR